jgi:hypothetical protein
VPHAQKNILKPWQMEAWCIPSVSAKFVWRMEDILDLYAEPDDAQYPLVCFDESPYQLVSEVCQPLPVRPGQPRRYDYEYRCEGTCNLFIFFEPLRGWRHVKVTDRRTAQDFAYCMKDLVNTHPPQAAVISAEAGFTLYPKHGSWLNMAEIEFAVVSTQYLDRRLGDQQMVRRAVVAWETRRTEQEGTADWRFTTTKARRKLKCLYPL